MASETSGSKGQPYFLSGGLVAIDVDSGIVADYAALVGNRLVSTSTPSSVNGKPIWAGLEWYNPSTKITSVYDSGWVATSTLPVTAGLPAFSSGWSYGTGTTSTIIRKDGRCYLNVQLVKTSNFTLGGTAMTLPAGFRPAATTAFAGPITTGANEGVVTWVIGTNGVVTVSWYFSPGGSPRTAWLVGDFDLP